MIKFSLYNIDLENNEAIKQKIKQDSKAVEGYISNLTDAIEKKSSSRKFSFVSDTVETRRAISEFYKDKNFSNLNMIIAKRLLYREQKAQEEILHLGKKIKKGTLFQSINSTGDEIEYVIAKVEAEYFLDDKDFELHTGLPHDKLTYRAALIRVKNDVVNEILVFDSRSGLTKYWWDSFLELRELHTDDYNTETAFSKITSFINRRVKKKDFKADNIFLRNSLNSYFQSRKNFDLDDLDAHLFGEYSPVNPELPLKRIRSDLKKLPERSNFDSKFNIQNEIIRNKFRITINLTEKIDLTIKEPVADLSHVISADLIDGEKCVVIRSEEGYNRIIRENRTEAEDESVGQISS